MRIDGTWRDPALRNCASGPAFPLLARFAGKFVLDIMPAALASVIGGFLFTQYQAGRAAPPAPAVQMSPASAEVLALVRDEHEAIIGYLKSQIAAEKNRLAAQDAETAQALADAKAAQNQVRENALAEQNTAEIRVAAAMPARHVASVASAKVALPRPTPSRSSAASRLAPAGFHSKAFGCAESGANAATWRVRMRRLRRPDRGPPSWEWRPWRTTAARSRASWKNR